MTECMCVHERFELMARRRPERVALSAPTGTVSYGELDARADRVARRLNAMGVGPEVIVGLCADRSVEMIVGLLGILKAGAAYLPLDPAYPASRVAWLLEDSGVQIVLATRGAEACLAGARVSVHDVTGLETDAGPNERRAAIPKVSAQNLAYVIYTSGSTGTPKGVLIEHRHVVRLFDATEPWFGFGPTDVWTLFHSISFDFSVWEIWGALLYGGRLVIVPSDVTRDPNRFFDLLHAEAVTVLNQTPSAFRPLIGASLHRGAPASLRLVIFGGEALRVEALAPWMAGQGDTRPALINMYGITETTVHVTYRRITAADLAQPAVSPIGEPIPDLEVHVLDEAGNPAPPGVPGEMWIAGAGLARGYLNRPELTSERFVHRQLAGGERRLYRSGDLAARTPEGDLLYFGRADRQIKVRGFRVEPAEIEACLARHPLVTQALVTSRDYGDGDVRIVSYIVASPDAQADAAERLATELAEQAKQQLPPHMRPSLIRPIAAVPLTANGKVDWDALDRAATAAPSGEPVQAIAQSDTERIVSQIGREILARPDISLHDDLFDFGGTSLSVVRMLSSINERFQVSLNGSELADEPTLARLAACVDAQLQSGYARA